ncbi:DUF805 domain-containing protein [Rubrivirga marina]|uniref:DUF805 domain-containing protein n=1 Tax=Rubrivirga marina TaxID=1196024 RepID=A0A271IX56_9BACT|nr:DUF805 domain-containing protein [Rubrivirga marina]PAP75803.1 hypothetical protein BSZ37_04775 [Rubrivirga marina]
MEWYLDVLKNHYADFDGRARRKEYWMFTLINVGIMIGLSIVAGILGAIWEPLGWLGYLVYIGYALAVIVPGIAVSIRRLHDTGKTGWLLLLGLIPLLGLVLIYFMVIEGDSGPNEYGPDPKMAADPVMGDLAF